MRVEASPATALGSKPGCHSTTPCPSTSMPRRPARPVSWVYSPGVMSAWVSPFHFDSFSMTTERAGMLMPSASVSVANTTRQSPRREQLLDALLERGQHAGVVGGDAAREAVQEVVVAEHVQVLVGDRTAALVDEGDDLVALLGRGELEVRVQALGHGGVAADPAEDEHDRRQQPGRSRAGRPRRTAWAATVRAGLDLVRRPCREARCAGRRVSGGRWCGRAASRRARPASAPGSRLRRASRAHWDPRQRTGRTSAAPRGRAGRAAPAVAPRRWSRSRRARWPATRRTPRRSTPSPTATPARRTRAGG